jgi:LysR family transcriptional regulator, regulator for metE and metH
VDLEIRHLKLVQAIAAEGSVTRAGERLHLTQSALSHQLRDAESRLGTPLFVRLGRKMLPTPAGERLLASAADLLGRLQATEDDIHRMTAQGEGLLRLTVECYTCYHWLPTLLDTYRRRHPRVEVRIVVEATKRPLQALLEGELDLAIVSVPVKDRRLTVRPLFQDEMLVILSPDHPLADRPFIRAEDFADQHMYIYSTPEDNTAIQTVLAPAGVKPGRVTQAQLSEAILELVRAGLGISVMARWAVAPLLASGELVGRPLTRKGLRRHWTSVRLKRPAPPAYLLEFEELLASDPLALSRGGRGKKSPAGSPLRLASRA